MNSQSENKLNFRQRQFCHYFVFGNGDEFRTGHGGKSYAKAYEKDFEISSSTCYSNAHRLLRNAEICSYIESILEKNGLNTMAIDARLREIILNGKDADSLSGIKEYNRIHGRLRGLKRNSSNQPTSLQQQALEEGII